MIEAIGCSCRSGSATTSHRPHELQETWHRDDAQEWAEIYMKIFLPYQLLIESYMKAQQVEKEHEQLDSQQAA